MKEIITVLVTGGGAPGIAGTLYALRHNPDGIKVKIVTCDVRSNAVGRYLADEFYVVPPAESPDFVTMLLQIATKAQVDVILPQVTRELLPLATNSALFESRGIKIAISAKKTIEQANDKWIVLEVAKRCGVPCPESILTKSEAELLQAIRYLGYPKNKVIVKPRLSNGLRGLRILSEQPWDVARFLSEKPESIEISLNNLLAILRSGEWPELIVQEFLPGVEYTVDVFRGRNGTIAVPRIREEIRSGITFQTKVDLRPDLQFYAIKLSEELDLKYAFGFQFKASDHGIPKLLECNPRVQGTMVTAAFAGSNVIWWAVKEALGEGVLPTDPDPEAHGMRFIRYWGGVAVYDEKKTAGPI